MFYGGCNAIGINIANRMMDNTTNFRFSTRRGQWQWSTSKVPDIQIYLLCQALLLEWKITKNNADFYKFHSISKFSQCSSLTFVHTHGNDKDRKTEEEEGWKFLHGTHVISPQIIEGLIGRGIRVSTVWQVFPMPLSPFPWRPLRWVFLTLLLQSRAVSTSESLPQSDLIRQR